MRRTFIAGLTLAASASALFAQNPPARPTFGEDGVTHVPAFDLPSSELSSAEAKAAQASRGKITGGAPPPTGDIAEVRRTNDMHLAGMVAAMRARYAVDVAEESVGGVPVRVFTPRGRAFDPKRILMNLHGGAFSVCWDACSTLESLPLAALGGFKVVSVNYRMAPEFKHPAAVEDVEKVYRVLLKRHKASSIGIYGCSAGGALTGQAAAWLPSKGLPQAGAVGIFGSGAVRFGKGDSAYIAGYIDGSFPPPPPPGTPPRPGIDRGYFEGADIGGPIVSAALHPAVMAKFPPALVITGTRAQDMSPANYTNSQLLKAGVRSTLIVEEAMGHCYIYQANLPEARATHRVIADFFRANLK